MKPSPRRLRDLDALSADEGFWDAQGATNSELRSKGLYVTQLCCADQVFLRRDWERRLLPIEYFEIRICVHFRSEMANEVVPLAVYRTSLQLHNSEVTALP